jgi:hypothetical protein
VGVYVPGGRAAYPSTVLMNAVPAQVAGVDRIAMVTPPGKLQPAVLAAAKEAGVTEIWRVGGAQAVAALAYGAGPIQPVDKIVGPGNAYVTAAKRRLYGVVGIDALAGPSEIVVVADNKNNPDWIAADLLSQAEHDPAAQSILITDDEAFAAAVEAAIIERLKTLATGEDAAASWRDHGAVIIAPLDESPGPGRRHRARARRVRGRQSRAPVGPRAPRWRDLPGPPHTGSDRRLRGRLQPRAADQPRGALPVGSVDLRLHQAHLDREVRRGLVRRPGPAHRGPGQGRGAARPRPVGVDTVAFRRLTREPDAADEHRHQPQDQVDRDRR